MFTPWVPPAPTFGFPVLASVTVTLLAAAFILICLFMMLVILIQKPKGGGLSGAFGGAGGGETSFVGARVGDFLTWLTVGCFVAFLLLAMFLTWTINPTELAAKQAELDEADTTMETAAPESTAPPIETPGTDGPTGPVEQAVDLITDPGSDPGSDDAAPVTEGDAAPTEATTDETDSDEPVTPGEAIDDE
jgi:preprotein translocase subunit SecG